MIFIDTSAFYAILDRDDRAHAAARTTWVSILSPPGAASLITSNYVLVESFALIRARLGIDPGLLQLGKGYLSEHHIARAIVPDD